MSDGSRPEPVVLLTSRIDPRVLRELVESVFGDMVKYVVDVRRNVAAVGGQMHADSEALLLAEGSRQEDLWGANYRPGAGPEACIEYESLINIRPAQLNFGMQVKDRELRERIREITYALLGSGEPLC
jgi:hypothetical protein